MSESHTSDTTPVSVMIKATVLDAPYLGVVVPHMIAQARYPFARRVVVVDRRVEFLGKYKNRPRATRCWIDDETAILHEWHPGKHRGAPPEFQRAARDAWKHNHRLLRIRHSAQRNPDGWGRR